jgi:hypothetical protein
MQKSVFEDMIDDESNTNHGTFWTKQEENNLLESIKENKSIDQISKDHKRSKGAIYGKLQQIATKMHNDGKSKDEIKKELKYLNDGMIEMATKKKTYPVKNNNDEIQEIKKTLDEIKRDLSILVESELKRSNMKREDFGDLSKLSNKNSDKEHFEWTDKILKKIEKYLDDDEKLKSIRKEYDIPKSIYNEKVASIKEKQKKEKK